MANAIGAGDADFHSRRAAGDRLVARLHPKPAERSDFTDFFGNGVTAIAFRDVHETLDIRMSARVEISRPEPGFDVSPT